MLLRRVLAPLLLAACLGSSEASPPEDQLHILFIGNSLTAANDLPGVVRRLGEAIDGKAPVTQSVAEGGFSLEDHWNRGEAQQAIAGDRWDMVVLQQGPSALPESRILLVEYSKTFDEEIRKVGGRPALYMVWPPAERAADWDEVTESYRTAAQALNGILFPVGEAFRAALRRYPGLTLFASDGFHPSSAGTYLAALVIYAQASHKSPLGISHRAGIADFPPQDIDAIEAGAAEAIERFSSP